MSLLANPPTNPALRGTNFAWVQHFIRHLAPQGMASIVLANGRKEHVGNSF